MQALLTRWGLVVEYSQRMPAMVPSGNAVWIETARRLLARAVVFLPSVARSLGHELEDCRTESYRRGE